MRSVTVCRLLPAVAIILAVGSVLWRVNSWSSNLSSFRDNASFHPAIEIVSSASDADVRRYVSAHPEQARTIRVQRNVASRGDDWRMAWLEARRLDPSNGVAGLSRTTGVSQGLMPVLGRDKDELTDVNRRSPEQRDVLADTKRTFHGVPDRPYMKRYSSDVMRILFRNEPDPKCLAQYLQCLAVCCDGDLPIRHIFVVPCVQMPLPDLTTQYRNMDVALNLAATLLALTVCVQPALHGPAPVAASWLEHEPALAQRDALINAIQETGW